MGAPHKLLCLALALEAALLPLSLCAPEEAGLLPRTVPLPFPYIVPTMTKAYHMAVPDDFLDMVTEDAKLLRHSATAGSFKDDKGTTWWQPRNSKRRFSVEQMIEVVGRLDFPDGLPDNIAGAEYWVQDKRGDNEGGFHYDKDESAASNQQRMIFPALSTVTYLSDGGGPTCIFNQTTNQFGNDEVPAIPKEGWLSFPQRGKHMHFNGHAQHGVSGSLCQSNCQDTRLVLLVNWWDHTPEPPNCQRLPTEQIKSIGMKKITKERLNEIKAMVSEGAQETPAMEMMDAVSTDGTKTISISLPPVDVVQLEMPKTFDDEIGKTIHFDLPWQRVSMLGELDPHKYTQQAHIKHSDVPIVLAFGKPARRASAEAVLRPLQMAAWTGGVARQHFEAYFGDTANHGVLATMQELGAGGCEKRVRQRDELCIALKMVPRGGGNSAVHIMKGQFGETELRQFLESFSIQVPDEGVLQGCVAAFDELARAFTEAAVGEASDAVAARAAKAHAELTGLDQKRADYYLKTMERVKEKGRGFVHREIARLERLSESGEVSGPKKTSMAERRNILAQFLAQE